MNKLNNQSIASKLLNICESTTGKKRTKRKFSIKENIDSVSVGDEIEGALFFNNTQLRRKESYKKCFRDYPVIRIIAENKYSLIFTGRINDQSELDELKQLIEGTTGSFLFKV